jgi:hypothetical protein
VRGPALRGRQPQCHPARRRPPHPGPAPPARPAPPPRQREHRGTLPAHLALDGKHIREHLGTIVTLCDIQEQVPVAVRATVEKGGEQSASRALLRSEQVSLLESTASLDNLYANPENARLIVQEQGGDYLISLKDNQPTLAAYATAQLAGAPFLPPNLKCAAANSSSAS